MCVWGGGGGALKTAEILVAESCHEQVSSEYGFKQRKGGRISENGWQRVQFPSPTFPLQCLFQGQFHRLYSPLHCVLKVNSITRIPYYSVHSDLIPIIRITLSTQAYFRSPAMSVTTPTEG